MKKLCFKFIVISAVAALMISTVSMAEIRGKSSNTANAGSLSVKRLLSITNTKLNPDSFRFNVNGDLTGLKKAVVILKKGGKTIKKSTYNFEESFDKSTRTTEAFVWYSVVRLPNEYKKAANALIKPGKYETTVILYSKSNRIMASGKFKNTIGKSTYNRDKKELEDLQKDHDKMAQVFKDVDERFKNYYVIKSNGDLCKLEVGYNYYTGGSLAIVKNINSLLDGNGKIKEELIILNSFMRVIPHESLRIEKGKLKSDFDTAPTLVFANQEDMRIDNEGNVYTGLFTVNNTNDKSIKDEVYVGIPHIFEKNGELKNGRKIYIEIDIDNPKLKSYMSDSEISLLKEIAIQKQKDIRAIGNTTDIAELKVSVELKPQDYSLKYIPETKGNILIINKDMFIKEEMDNIRAKK